MPIHMARKKWDGRDNFYGEKTVSVGHANLQGDKNIRADELIGETKNS